MSERNQVDSRLRRNDEKGRKTPQWTIPFLGALERTGEVQAAAADAGVDKRTAYARRKAHPDFGQAWDEAVYRYTAAKEAREAEEIARLEERPSTSLGTNGKAAPLLASTALSGGQVKRVSAERWGERKEQIFFDELAATNNIHRAAAAAGVSYNAVHARRLRNPLFAAKWDAVARSARATIDMHLLEETRKSFDPDALSMPDGPPRVTIDQAIKISQIGASKRQDDGPESIAERAARMTKDDVDELRGRLVEKLQRLRRRERPKLLAQGWSYDEEYDREIPPGWVKASPAT